MRLLLLVLLASGCSPRPDASGGTASGASGSDPIVGTVTSVDLSPMAYDGDAIILLDTDAGETVPVHIAARMHLCAARGLALVSDLSAGDRIEVVGEMGEDGAIRPCADTSHRLSREGTTSATWEGTYVSGFETASFRSCDAPGESWWLQPNAEFSARYQAITEAQGVAPGRGLRPHVRVVFEGDRSARGEHGHVGASPYEIRPTRILEMEFLASGDGEWPDVPCGE